MTVVEPEITAAPTTSRELRSAGMLGYGCAQPSKVVTSAEIAARYDLTEDWIVERTGVRSRRVLDLEKDETLLTLVAAASKDALEVAGRDASEIDTVIVATITPDNVFPAEAVALAAAIGVPQTAVVFDLSAASPRSATPPPQSKPGVRIWRSWLEATHFRGSLRMTIQKALRCSAMPQALSSSARSSPAESDR
jgi:hypothetical protein